MVRRGAIARRLALCFGDLAATPRGSNASADTQASVRAPSGAIGAV